MLVFVFSVYGQECPVITRKGAKLGATVVLRTYFTPISQYSRPCVLILSGGVSQGTGSVRR